MKQLGLPNSWWVNAAVLALVGSATALLGQLWSGVGFPAAGRMNGSGSDANGNGLVMHATGTGVR